MKKMTKLAAAIALASGAMSVQTQAVEVSATAGFVTDYYFRGVSLGDAGAWGSLDVDLGSGFYAGTWIIDDDDNGDDANDGLETDFYIGWATEFESGLSLDISYNRYEYTYTSDFEDEYVIGLGYGAFSVSYFDGTAHDEESTPNSDEDYKGWTFGISGDVFGFSYGHSEVDESDSDAEYDWVELSASGEVVGLDVTAVLGKTTNVDGDALEFGDTASGDGYFFLDVSKSFDL